MFAITGLQIHLDLDEHDWEAYTHLSASARVAEELNRLIERAVNTGADPREVYNKAWTFMCENDHLGFADSEPRWKLEELVDRLQDIYAKRY